MEGTYPPCRALCTAIYCIFVADIAADCCIFIADVAAVIPLFRRCYLAVICRCSSDKNLGFSTI
jgi:hypothetical protein